MGTIKAKETPLPKSITTSHSRLEELSKEFPKGEVKQRSGRGGLSLDYISIDSTIRRLNEVLGFDWDFLVSSCQVILLADGSFAVTVSGELVVTRDKEGNSVRTSRTGVGASTGKDLDDTSKTALAEAIKKAGNLYGIALYLWDETKRIEIASYRTWNNASISFLQRIVKDKGIDVSKFSTKELRDRSFLISLLEANSASVSGQDG